MNDTPRVHLSVSLTDAEEKLLQTLVTDLCARVPGLMAVRSNVVRCLIADAAKKLREGKAWF